MIRQAISCDICGMEMQHTHRCFVAYDKGNELRVSGWVARRRMRSGALHLCGQKCLHQLVDQFMARTLAADAQADPAKPEQKQDVEKARRADGSLTSLRTGFFAGGAERPFEDASELRARLAVPLETRAEVPIEVAADRPGLPNRAWRSAAWLREREREQREAGAGRAGAHRRSIA